MPERIVILRLGSMGDILHTLPAVCLLRHAFPLATIGWAVEQRWTPLLVADGTPAAGPRSPQRPLVDAVHVTNTLAWRRALFSDETWAEACGAVRALRDAAYELAIDFQGAWKSAVLAQLSHAPSRVGFAQPREKPATMFYTEQVQAAGRHIVEQNLSLARAVIRSSGIAVDEGQPIPCPLPYDEAADAVAGGVLLRHRIERFAIINPGAGWGAKQWPPERYGEVARALAARELRSIINYGPGQEELAHAVEQASGGTATAVPASIGELIAFTRRASLLVGGDTGPTHLAAALGVPVVALYGPTDPARTGPYSANSIVLRSHLSVTETSHRPEAESGLLSIRPDEVIIATELLLARTGAAQ